jgi:hypothetical protein
MSKLKYTTIQAHYAGDSRDYTFRIPFELAQGVMVGDILAVKAANGLGLVRVLAVHETPQDNGPYNWKWAFQKIDLDQIDFIERMDSAGEIERSEFYFDDEIPF